MSNQKELTPITEELVTRLISVVGCGLVKGLGEQEPGKMCVEAAVCYAYGIPHSDNPPCVGYAVRAYKIGLNDADWSSNEARAQGMLGVSIAQLNSVEIDQVDFVKRITLKTINTIIADLAVKYLPAKEQEFRTVNDLVTAAQLCNELWAAAEYAKYAAKYAAESAAEYAKYAAESAAEYAKYAKYAAEYAEYAAEYAEYAAESAAEYAKYAAEYAKYAAKDPDAILRQAANNCLEVLIEMKSPGCEYLYLIEKDAS